MKFSEQLGPDFCAHRNRYVSSSIFLNISEDTEKIRRIIPTFFSAFAWNLAISLCIIEKSRSVMNRPTPAIELHMALFWHNTLHPSQQLQRTSATTPLAFTESTTPLPFPLATRPCRPGRPVECSLHLSRI